MPHIIRNTAYNFAKTVAKPFGLYPFFGSYRRHLLSLLLRQNVNCVLDVGAHFGEWGTILRDIGYRGRIISFEPVKASFAKLQNAARGDTRWDICNFALGAENTSQEIYLYQASDWNSFLQASDHADDSFPHHADDRGREVVMVRRLETVVPELDLANSRIYLKLDTQGYDRRVVIGAASVLEKVVAMQSEMPGIRPLYREQPDMLETLVYYRSLGYAPTGFFPLNLEKDGTTVIEFDVVLARFTQDSYRAEL